MYVEQVSSLSNRKLYETNKRVQVEESYHLYSKWLLFSRINCDGYRLDLYSSACLDLMWASLRVDVNLFYFILPEAFYRLFSSGQQPSP